MSIKDSLEKLKRKISRNIARKKLQKDRKTFKVKGAGKIIISSSPHWSCGTAKGFHFAVSWGDRGEVGGVIDRKEAIRLVYHILASITKNYGK